jgi:DNA polymerase III epsilon subunit-like protein
MLSSVLNLPIIGLDCETSGTDLSQNHALIETGLAFFNESNGLLVFSSLVSPSTSFSWSESSASIHNIALSDVIKAPSHDTVDNLCVNFLDSLPVTPAPEHPDFIAVGFNVASFDFPFFAKFLPKTFSLFSYRAIDINSLCFLLDGFPYNGSVLYFNDWKLLAKQQSLKFLQENSLTGSEHRAGFDAALGLGCFLFLRNVITNIFEEKVS